MLNRCDFRCVLKVENVRDRRIYWKIVPSTMYRYDECCMFSEVDGAGRPAGEAVELPANTDADLMPAPSSSASTSRIPRLTTSLRRHLPVLAGLRHDRDRKPPCAAATPAATVTIGTVQPATPPSSKVSTSSSSSSSFIRQVQIRTRTGKTRHMHALTATTTNNATQ